MRNSILQIQCDSHRRRSNTYDFVNLLTYRHGNVVDKWILVLCSIGNDLQHHNLPKQVKMEKKNLSHCLLVYVCVCVCVQKNLGKKFSGTNIRHTNG